MSYIAFLIDYAHIRTWVVFVNFYFKLFKILLDNDISLYPVGLVQADCAIEILFSQNLNNSKILTQHSNQYVFMGKWPQKWCYSVPWEGGMDILWMVYYRVL